MSIIKVNDFAIRAESEDIKIDSIKSSDIYGDASFLRPKVLQSIRRFESNIKVCSKNAEGLTVTNFKLLDEIEIKQIRSRSKKYPYLHMGAILFCITPLIPNYRELSGRIVLYDGSALDVKSGFIGMYDFNFKDGAAFFVFRPEHLLSATDPFLSETFRFAIDIPGINFPAEREVLGLDVGCIYRMSSSARFLSSSSGEGGWAQQEIRGCSFLEYDREKVESQRSIGEVHNLQEIGTDTKISNRGFSMPSRITRRRRYISASRSKARSVDPGMFRSASIKFESSHGSSSSSHIDPGRNSVCYPPGNNAALVGFIHKTERKHHQSDGEDHNLRRNEQTESENDSVSLSELPLRERSTVGDLKQDPVAKRDSSNPWD
uniref:Movement protein n=1 Tax=Linum macraei betaflexivirus TaxID=2933101 RepID=A0A9C7LLR2_9VIRU|nr:putative movement protein [Linum macraei betaflexivirus]CAI5385155.1 putative movement protein [Linum macraei betaflexivirus]